RAKTEARLWFQSKRGVAMARVRRLHEQRWLLDAVIRTVGIEWDQARIASKSRPLGAELEAEMRAVARRVRKFDDFHREFAAQAKKREALAQAFEAQGRTVAAREAYLAASLLWSTACWPIDEDNALLRGYEARVNDCFAHFIKYAPYPIERVDIPFGDK